MAGYIEYVLSEKIYDQYREKPDNFQETLSLAYARAFYAGTNTAPSVMQRLEEAENG